MSVGHWLYTFRPTRRLGERLLARRWRRGPGSLSVADRAVMDRVKACSPHPNREPNPNATALDPEKYRAERCLDCGTGVVTRLRD